MTEKEIGEEVINEMDAMIAKIQAIKKDFAKFMTGKSAPAGTRTRKCMQAVIAGAKLVRQGVTDISHKQKAARAK